METTNIEIGDLVEVEDNSGTHGFIGFVIDSYKDIVDGFIFSIRDQEDNIWDIEAKYIILKENSIKKN